LLGASVEVHDTCAFRECLSTLERLNDRYRAIVAARYAHLLDRHAGDTG
jgi:hypothetical protein